MFGIGIKQQPVSHEEALRAIELDRQERKRKSEENASPLAKEIARLMRDEPERWTEKLMLMAHDSGLKLNIYVSSSPYVATTFSVEKGDRTTDFPTSDVSFLCSAHETWRAWRNKQHAEEILAELKAAPELKAWKCPINHEGCTRNCGNYGCGN